MHSIALELSSVVPSVAYNCVLCILYCRTLTFRVRLGGSGGCETVDAGEDVVVEYKPAGFANYALLQRLPYTGIICCTVDYSSTVCP